MRARRVRVHRHPSGGPAQSARPLRGAQPLQRALQTFQKLQKYNQLGAWSTDFVEVVFSQRHGAGRKFPLRWYEDLINIKEFTCL